MSGERLQKVLAHAGIASRRAVEELIVAGRVKVNGVAAHLGQRVDADKDVVEVDGSPVPLQVDLRYYLVNKPAGMVTTARDEFGRATVMELIDTDARVWPVGRLDTDTEGALIVTNDGDLTARLTHPRYGVEKLYLATVRGGVTRAALRKLVSGVDLEDGHARAADARLVSRAGADSLVEIVMTEGRKREVRRLLAAVGHPVSRLARVGIGPVRLGRLKPGTYRKLAPREVQALYAASVDQQHVDK